MSKNFATNKLKISINRTKAATIALVLLLSFAATLVTTLPVSGIYEASVAYLYVTPDPIGVNQMWLIEAWVTPRPMYSGWNYSNLVFTFKKPSGATESVTIPFSEETGTTWFNWVPDVVGIWTVTFYWAGNVNRSACSVTHSLIVQEDPIPGYPDTPLPTDGPLTWPVNPENRLWPQIMGGWWGSGYNESSSNFNPYTESPGSPHILWRLPPYSGIAGFQGVTTTPTSTGGYYPTTTPAYVKTYATMSASSVPITTVMVGRAYGVWNGLIHCLNVRTGEELWSRPGTFTAGQMAATPVLISPSSGNRLIKYNALSGATTLNVSIPSGMGGTFVDPMVYVVTTLANQTRRFIGWTTAGTTTTFANRVLVNRTYTRQSDPLWLNPVLYAPEIELSYKLIADRGTIGWGTASCFVRVKKTPTSPLTDVWVHLTYTIYGPSYAINCTSGAIIWMHNVFSIGERMAIGCGAGLAYVPVAVEGMQRWVAYDALTGVQKFIMDPGTYPFGAFFAYSSSNAYGCIWSGSYDGHMYGWNQTNGKTEVSIFIGSAWPGETPYGAGGQGNSTWCTNTAVILGGGKAYGKVGEWGTPTPYYRGSGMFCGDAFTGERLWRLRGYWSISALAEGILFASNTYDGYRYAIGKGPSSTEVSVDTSRIAKGETVWITGRVLDQSPALMGQPCLSSTEGGDTGQKIGGGAQNGGSLSAYEEYLFMQQPLPTDLVGVPVNIIALSSNGTVIDLGQTTSNGNGDFFLKWTPPSEDYYYITASFYGDESYYSSWNLTHVKVGPAPPEVVTPEPVSQQVIPDYTPMFAGIIAAVAVVAVIGIANLLALRKRK